MIGLDLFPLAKTLPQTLPQTLPRCCLLLILFSLPLSLHAVPLDQYNIYLHDQDQDGYTDILLYSQSPSHSSYILYRATRETQSISNNGDEYCGNIPTTRIDTIAEDGFSPPAAINLSPADIQGLTPASEGQQLLRGDLRGDEAEDIVVRNLRDPGTDYQLISSGY